MSSEELFALIALATVGTFTPGPNTALSATIAANHGLRRALPFVCAVPAGWGVLLVLNAGLHTLVYGAAYVQDTSSDQRSRQGQGRRGVQHEHQGGDDRDACARARTGAVGDKDRGVHNQPALPQPG